MKILAVWRCRYTDIQMILTIHHYSLDSSHSVFSGTVLIKKILDLSFVFFGLQPREKRGRPLYEYNLIKGQWKRGSMRTASQSQVKSINNIIDDFRFQMKLTLFANCLSSLVKMMSASQRGIHLSNRGTWWYCDDFLKRPHWMLIPWKKSRF